MERNMSNLNREELIALRKQVRMGSLFLTDYDNTLGIDRNEVCDFFDSFMEELAYEMEQEIPDYKDNMFWDYIEEYDTDDRLWDYYFGCDWYAH